MATNQAKYTKLSELDMLPYLLNVYLTQYVILAASTMSLSKSHRHKIHSAAKHHGFNFCVLINVCKTPAFEL